MEHLDDDLKEIADMKVTHSFSIPVGLLLKLKRKAREMGMTISQLVTYLLEKALKEEVMESE